MLVGMFHTMFMVFLLSSHSGPQSVAMSGSHFLSHFTMVQSLYTAISYAIWQNIWANAEHNDCNYTIAKMLVWQAHFQGGNAPFKGKNLYTLLMFGKLHHPPPLLEPLPDHARWFSWQWPHWSQDIYSWQTPSRCVGVHVTCQQSHCLSYAHMKPSEREAYTEFWREVASFYLAELEFCKQYKLQAHSNQSFSPFHAMDVM